MQYVIVLGNPINGYRIIGPIESRSAATRTMRALRGKYVDEYERAWVTELWPDPETDTLDSEPTNG